MYYWKKTIQIFIFYLSLCSLISCSSTAVLKKENQHTAPVTLAHRKDRVVVSIYEFRSSVYEISPRGATDMFKTALIKNGHFQLVERARLNEGVIREKQLNMNGQSNGTSAQKQLRSVEYLFEASISEISGGESQTQGGINIAGFQIGGGSNTDYLGIDVRIIDANNGDVLDAINLRHPIKSGTAQIAGAATLIQTVRAMRGKETSVLMPDVNVQTTRKESIDVVLRDLINEAVTQLAARFQAPSNQD